MHDEAPAEWAVTSRLQNSHADARSTSGAGASGDANDRLLRVISGLMVDLFRLAPLGPKAEID
jgi:hypothetical protein